MERRENFSSKMKTMRLLEVGEDFKEVSIQPVVATVASAILPPWSCVMQPRDGLATVGETPVEAILSTI